MHNGLHRCTLVGVLTLISVINLDSLIFTLSVFSNDKGSGVVIVTMTSSTETRLSISVSCRDRDCDVIN